MRKFLISAVSLIAFASSSEHSLAQTASSTPKHTWYKLNGDTVTCELSSQTPEQFQNFVRGFSYLRGGDPIGQTLLIRLLDKEIKTCHCRKHGHSRLPNFAS
jgi:hypothetical protein